MKKKIIYLLPVLLFFLTAVNLTVLQKRLASDIELQKSLYGTMYTDVFARDLRYPDLFLRNIVKERKVLISREAKTYDQYDTFGRDEEEGNPFDSRYLTENDYIRWFKLYAGAVEVDGSLPSGDEVEKRFSPVKDEFTDIGEANDMLRYSFALNHEKIQQASAFWYSWFYNSFSERITKEKGKDLLPNIYVNLDGAEDAEAFVAVWTENGELFFMTEEKYGELCKRM